MMSRRTRTLIVVGCVAAVAIGVTVAVLVTPRPSPEGRWRVGDSTDEWVAITARNAGEDDLFTPEHDGKWIHHRGVEAQSGLWRRIPNDVRNIEMWSHVSGPMYARDGTLTIDGAEANWQHSMFRSDVSVLRRE